MNATLPSDLIKYLPPVFERKAVSVTGMDIRQLTSYADNLLIIEAGSGRQVTSIAEHVIKEMKRQGVGVLGAEGVKEGEWALLDYGDTIIHIFQSETKALYDLEGLWADAPRIDLSEFNRPFDPEDDDDL